MEAAIPPTSARYLRVDDIVKSMFILFTQLEIVPLFVTANAAILKGDVVEVEIELFEISSPSTTASEPTVANNAMLLCAD